MLKSTFLWDKDLFTRLLPFYLLSDTRYCEISVVSHVSSYLYCMFQATPKTEITPRKGEFLLLTFVFMAQCTSALTFRTVFLNYSYSSLSTEMDNGGLLQNG